MLRERRSKEDRCEYNLAFVKNHKEGWMRTERATGKKRRKFHTSKSKG